MACMAVELWNSHNEVSAIEGGCEALTGLGVIGSNKVLGVGVKERVEVDHVPGHGVVGPFKYLIVAGRM
jgi:hypothetical protein